MGVGRTEKKLRWLMGERTVIQFCADRLFANVTNAFQIYFYC